MNAETSTPDGSDVGEDFDHRVPSAQKEPWEMLHELRDACPVAHNERYGEAWILSRYEDVFAAARDHETFSSADGVAFPQHPFPPSIPIEIDPPQHHEFRAALLDRFSPPVVKRSLPFFQDIIGGAIDEVIESGRCEAIEDILHPMVGGVTQDLLGFPREDMGKLTFWAAKALEGGDDSMMIVGEVIEYCAEIYEDRRANPVDDIPSMLVQMSVDGREINEDEFLRTMLALFIAGLDTTVSAGAYMLEWLAEHPERRDELAADPDVRPSAIEEFLRFFSPIPSLRRLTTHDTEIEGCPVSSDTNVLLFWMSANHDPAEFDSPDEVDFSRHPNRHVAFGAGIHRCLGAHVARQELSVLLDQVLERMPDLSIDPDKPVERYEGTTRGIRHLDLLFTPGSRQP